MSKEKYIFEEKKKEERKLNRKHYAAEKNLASVICIKS